MRHKIPSLLVVLTTLLVTTHLNAQEQISAQSPEDAANFKLMTDALKLRVDAADAIVQSKETSAALILRLKTIASPTGLKLNPDADFGLAAVEIGQRVLSAGKPIEAAVLFGEAEKSLATAVASTPDAKAGEKATFLAHLAFLRGNYLNNAAQAKLDLEQAIALQPDDKALKQALTVLSYSHADLFTTANQTK